MKICLSGTHAIGKTSLVQALAYRLRLKILPEIIREICPKLDLPSYHDMPRVKRHHLQRVLLHLQYLREEGLVEYVTDRSVLDIVAYLTAEGGVLTEKEIRDVMNHMSKFDLVVIPRIEFPIVSDGFRHEDPHYQITVQEQFIKLMTGKHNALFVDGSVKDRVDQICKALYDRQLS